MKRAIKDVSRRHFLKTSAAYGTISFLPSAVALGAKSGQLPPSERVNLAVVGIGGRGNGVRMSMLNSGHCNVVALCDVDAEGSHTQMARYAHQVSSKPPGLKANQELPERYPKARFFTDFREMFDKMGNEIDAVQVSTPDHSHFTIAMLAMSLGKHVYVEKPLAHSFGECERLIDLATRSGVATQMGNQGHSGANYFQFKEWSKAGIIKDVTRVTAHMNKSRRWHPWGTGINVYPDEPIPEGMAWDVWLNSAPVNPFSGKLHPGNWRGWYDYGSGAFGDWGPHILDTCHRFLKLGLPSKVTAVKRQGLSQLVFPMESTIQFSFPERMGMPACDITWYDGQQNVPAVEEEYGELVDDKVSGRKSRKPVELKSPGKIIYSKELVFRGGSHSSPLTILPKEKYMDMRRSLPTFPQKNSNHYENFLLACKGQEKTRSPFEVSGPLAQVFNLGVIAQRLGGALEFDRKSKRFKGNKIANAMLDPAPRKGWEEFYRL